MKFLEVFRFEFTYQLRQLVTLLSFVVLMVVGFLMTLDGMLAEALHDEFFINSSFAVAKTTIVGCLLWLLIAPVVAGQAAARDVVSRMYPLVYSTPVSKAEYLGGKFLAAFAINAVMMLAVQISIFLAIYLPGVDEVLIGPFKLSAYLTAYAYLSLPNALVATIIQFALASKSGRPMAAYLGSFTLFSMSYIVGLFLLLSGQQGLANLLDLIGVHFVLSDLSHLWTNFEKNHRVLGLDGVVLFNRLLWLTIGLIVMFLGYITFRFKHRSEGLWIENLFRRKKLQQGDASSNERIKIPLINRRFDTTAGVRQVISLAFSSFRNVTTSWAGLFMIIIVPLMIIPVVIDQMSDLGVRLLPTSIQVIGELTGPISSEMSRWIIVPLLIVFFAGELIWREREAGLGDITDSLPGSDWVPMIGKFLGITLLLILFISLQIVAGIVAQSILGYTDYEIGLYIQIIFGLQLPEYILFAVVAFAVHVIINNKYIGHLAGVMCFVLIAIAPVFGLEHNLLIYSASPSWSYTDMRGFGNSVGPWLWFKLYWTAWALLIAVVARLAWVRGKESGLKVRMQLFKQRYAGGTRLTSRVSMILVAILGALVFYNTNILNEYLTASDINERKAEYEKLYAKYADVNQPQVTKAKLEIELFPKESNASLHGSYHLVNQGTTPIESFLVSDSIVTLEKPLAPGESFTYEFNVNIKSKGFKENGVDNSITEKATFFDASNWLPSIGYQTMNELTSPSARRKYGLSPKPIISSLYDRKALNKTTSGILLDVQISTDENQIAVAPGALRRAWTENGRQLFHYTTDTPIGNEWVITSAPYTLRKEQWNDVTIQIFHVPNHATQIDRLIQSVRASLKYYSKEFGPYAYGHHLTFVERPGSGTGLHADPAMVHYSENFGVWTPNDEPGSLDLPYAVVAHEMGHQWNTPYAFVEGAPVMSESLAWYYGMKQFEHSRGPEHLRYLLDFMREPHPYAPIRRGEPLLRGLDPYMSYRKGPFALYALSDYIGEANVNRALRSLREKHLPDTSTLVTTLDLFNELKAVTPDSSQYLLHDLFEVNTFWDLTIDKAIMNKVEINKWVVTLEITADKTVADIEGTETKLPLDEWIDIGVFGRGASGDELSNPIYIRKHRIKSGRQKITLVLNKEPVLAGVDPYHILDVVEKEDDDNIEPVEYR